MLKISLSRSGASSERFANLSYRVQFGILVFIIEAVLLVNGLFYGRLKGDRLGSSRLPFWKAKKNIMTEVPVSKNNEIPYALFTLQPQGTSTLPHHPLQKSAGSTPGTYLHPKRNWRVLRSLFILIGFCSALRSLSFWSVTQILDAFRYRWWLRTVWKGVLE